MTLYIIETKLHFYSLSNSCKHVFKVLQPTQSFLSQTSITTSKPPTVTENNHKKIASINTVKDGKWLLVKYESEFFLGVVLTVSTDTGSALVRCLEKPFGISDPPKKTWKGTYICLVWTFLNVYCSSEAIYDPSQKGIEVYLLKLFQNTKFVTDTSKCNSVSF